MHLELNNLVHRYGARQTLRGLSMALESGEIGCLLGPSGCGKTTALRCIAGFESIDEGEISVSGVSLSRPGFTEAPERRQIGMVFQEAALLPHLTAAQNIAFGLHRQSAIEQRHRSDELLAMVGLKGFAAQYPHELSGGQQQRVALARALAPEPRLILLDEPFSNLDVALKERLGRDVRDILKQTGVTALLVTHDQNEAFTLADRIGVMADGVIKQWGTAHNIYHYPVDRGVAAFVGSGVFLDATIKTADTVEVAGVMLRGSIDSKYRAGDRVDLLLRPDDVVADDDGMVAMVQRRVFQGSSIVYTLTLENGETVLASLSPDTDVAENEQLCVRIAPSHLVMFAKTP